mgnify:FL=1
MSPYTVTPAAFRWPLAATPFSRRAVAWTAPCAAGHDAAWVSDYDGTSGRTAITYTCEECR